ncbi:MAG: hypothetical protein VW644_14470, partial [Alphaproteobacteria bacterium]
RTDGRFAWGRYLGKRLLRIAPAYLFVLAIVVAGLIPLYRVSTDDLSFRIGYHMLFLQDYLRADIVVAFWSLGVEEKFYLLAPFLMLAVLRIERPARQAGFLLGLVGLVLLVRSWSAWTMSGIDTYADFFPAFRSPFHMVADGLLLGVLCRTLWRHRECFGWLTQALGAHLLFWAGAVLIGWLLLDGALMAEIRWFDKTLQGTAIPAAFAAMMRGFCAAAARGLCSAQRACSSSRGFPTAST